MEIIKEKRTRILIYVSFPDFASSWIEQNKARGVQLAFLKTLANVSPFRH